MTDSTSALPLVVVGSVGIDDIETPRASRAEVLGGSASYACAAASFFARPGMVGIVGTDFPDNCFTMYRDFGIDTTGLQQVDGRTFRWAGVYEENMNVRRTLRTELNVFADFSPELPQSYRSAPFVFLGNIHPELQAHVLDQVPRPQFVAVDTMDLWIETARDKLMEVVARVDMLLLNDSEAQHLTGLSTPVEAGRQLLEAGPRFVLVKKGEHGSMLFSRDGLFILPAYPVEEVHDPTGAGDTFAGGLMGSLAAAGTVSDATLRTSMLYGSTIAAFNVEDFGLERLRRIERADIEARADAYRDMLNLPG